ncbi:MAG: hypothetical protein A3C02_00970 [Candidatus Andersenbacteria bacterium RIFCSPHIGHO2_02_FULL_45_11]|uniref:Uncharacterized protein n=1 Tax=Candidatus Andersenbacteria bacterium RIFCSPHIGHO2_12_FULL_45_11 TaxID=1797281 RepID=A0A1G1WZI9_9BACT|nr:MAG: hypothetical protein A3D99_01540 [Candidatus Andersenbacteria bacterium RIFCSPHIGHO2_12_FULL_45_11]OGY33148.1 MAG: hypothetical protein A3C02_00970 [Candidatus Andersenbacteria bacterium RIFCSPHIGHO2_02_FULL_45_11]
MPKSPSENQYPNIARGAKIIMITIAAHSFFFLSCMSDINTTASKNATPIIIPWRSPNTAGIRFMNESDKIAGFESPSRESLWTADRLESRAMVRSGNGSPWGNTISNT